MKMYERDVRAVINDACKEVDAKCGVGAGKEKRAAMLQLVLAERTAAAERQENREKIEKDAAHKACAAAAARAKVAEQCRDAAEAAATGWKIVAAVAVTVAIVCAVSADGNHRDAAYWKTKAQTTNAQQSIARIERDMDLDCAVVWYR